MTKDKLCPLRHWEAESTNLADDMVIYCRSDCAWFNESEDECSMLTLGKNMAGTSFFLENISNSLDEKNNNF